MPTGTNRWGTVPWGTGGSSIGSGLVLDVLDSFHDVIYRLGFARSSEMTSTAWVTETELFQWADEAVKRLSYEVGAFVTYDASVSVLQGTAVYALPASHVFTLAAGLLYESNIQLLRLTPVRDLWALDGYWATTQGNPVRCSLDAGAVGTITLYPQPLLPSTLGQICQECPATVTPQASTLALPTPLQDYFSYVMLAGARGKESEMADHEMAAHYRQRCLLYEAVMEHLFGPGQ